MTSETVAAGKRVYFDSNVYADLALCRIPDADKLLSLIRKAVTDKRLVVVPSIEVFGELVPVSQVDEMEFRKRWRLMHELGDWSHTLKPANELLKDDFISFARTGHADNPYVTREVPYYGAIATLASMTTPPSPMELKQLTQQAYDHKGGFADVINQAGKDWHGKRPFPPSFTFAQFWLDSIAISTDESNSFPKMMVNALAESLGIGEQCRAQGLGKLLLLPTVLLPIGYWTYSWHRQVTRGSVEKPSFAFDFRHCTLAGAAGIFVTGDKVLRNAIKEIPGHNVQAMSLPELVATLQVAE